MHLEIVEPLVECVHVSSDGGTGRLPSHAQHASHHRYHHSERRSPHMLDRWLSWLSAADVKDMSSTSNSSSSGSGSSTYSSSSCSAHDSSTSSHPLGSRRTSTVSAEHTSSHTSYSASRPHRTTPHRSTSSEASIAYSRAASASSSFSDAAAHEGAASKFDCLSHRALVTPSPLSAAAEEVKSMARCSRRNNDGRRRYGNTRGTHPTQRPSCWPLQPPIHHTPHHSSTAVQYRYKLRALRQTCHRLRQDKAALLAEVSALRASLHEASSLSQENTLCGTVSCVEQGTQTACDHIDTHYTVGTHALQDACMVHDQYRQQHRYVTAAADNDGEHHHLNNSSNDDKKPYNRMQLPSHMLAPLSSGDEAMSYCSTPGITSAAAKPSEEEAERLMASPVPPLLIAATEEKEEECDPRLMRTLPFTSSSLHSSQHQYHQQLREAGLHDVYDEHLTPPALLLPTSQATDTQSKGSSTTSSVQRAAQTIAQAEGCLQEMGSSSRKLAELMNEMQRAWSAELALDESESGEELMTSFALCRELQY